MANSVFKVRFLFWTRHTFVRSFVVEGMLIRTVKIRYFFHALTLIKFTFNISRVASAIVEGFIVNFVLGTMCFAFMCFLVLVISSLALFLALFRFPVKFKSLFTSQFTLAGCGVESCREIAAINAFFGCSIVLLVLFTFVHTSSAVFIIVLIPFADRLTCSAGNVEFLAVLARKFTLPVIFIVNLIFFTN